MCSPLNTTCCEKILQGKNHNVQKCGCKNEGFYRNFGTSCLGSRVFGPGLDRQRFGVTARLQGAPGAVTRRSSAISRNDLKIFTGWVIKCRFFRIGGEMPKEKQTKTTKKTKQNDDHKCSSWSTDDVITTLVPEATGMKTRTE